MTEKYNPLFINDNLMSNLPRDRKSINAIARSLYAMVPQIHSIIDCNALLPVQYLKIKKTKDKKINQFWETQFENIDIQAVLETSMQEYWITGEAFIYGELEKSAGMWEELRIQNPDYILVKKHIDGSEKFFLRPDENWRRIVLSDNPEDLEQLKQLSPHIIDAIKQGKNIELDNFYLSCFRRKTMPYEIRGTTPLLPIFGLYYTTQFKIAEKDIDAIKALLFDVNFSPAAHTRHSQIFAFLESWFAKKIIAPISNIQQFKSSPVITFDRALFKKDIEKSQSQIDNRI